MPLSLVQRLLHTLAPRPPRREVRVRLDVCPPLARRPAQPWRRRLRAWLAAGLSEDLTSTAFQDWSPSVHNQTALVEARQAFRSAFDDIAEAKKAATLDRIRAARSLHELWHLRAEAFSLVSCHHSQGEADRRLGLVDRHFPSRKRHAGRAATATRDGTESVPPL